AGQLRVGVGRLGRDHDIGAVGGGTLADRQPDTAGGAGDEKGLAFEAHAALLNTSQIFEKSGLRFSMKAPKASLAAGSPNRREKLCPSSAICCSTSCCWPFFISRLVSISEPIGVAASLCAAACATPLASVGGTTRLTRPTSSAASAMKGSPSSNASAAR